jgi:hypothetical protein
VFCMYLRTDSEFAVCNINSVVVITETEIVRCAVRTGSSENMLRFIRKGLTHLEAVRVKHSIN